MKYFYKANLFVEIRLEMSKASPYRSFFQSAK